MILVVAELDGLVEVLVCLIGRLCKAALSLCATPQLIDSYTDPIPFRVHAAATSR
jgi:hypothetical protein